MEVKPAFLEDTLWLKIELVHIFLIISSSDYIVYIQGCSQLVHRFQVQSDILVKTVPQCGIQQHKTPNTTRVNQRQNILQFSLLTSSNHRKLSTSWSDSCTDIIRKAFQCLLLKQSCTYGIGSRYLNSFGQTLAPCVSTHSVNTLSSGQKHHTWHALW